MKFSAAKLNTMTRCKPRALGESALYAQLQAQNWFRGDRSYRPASFDRRKDLIHFTETWSIAGRGICHSRLDIFLKLALECGGDLAHSTVLN